MDRGQLLGELSTMVTNTCYMTPATKGADPTLSRVCPDPVRRQRRRGTGVDSDEVMTRFTVLATSSPQMRAGSSPCLRTQARV